VDADFADTQEPMWERACPRRGRPIQHHSQQTHRFREQARSHNGLVVDAILQTLRNPCGSEPARDSDGASSTNANGPDATASRSGPHLANPLRLSHFLRRLAFAFGDQLAGQGDQALAIIDGVFKGIEAADQEGGDAQVVVVEQSIGDLFRCAHQ